MKILVTGMTSHQVKEEDTFAGTIASALRLQGHDVTVEPPSLQNVIDGENVWDHVFVGIGPLHGLGTAYKYGALGTIGLYWSGKVTLFTDDTDTAKMGSGLKLFYRDEWRLTKPFYSYVKEYSLASQTANAAWLQSVIRAMVDTPHDEYPHVVIPSFTFDNAFEIAHKIAPGAGPRAVTVDAGAFAPRLLKVTDESVNRHGTPIVEHDGPWWATEFPHHKQSQDHPERNSHVRAMGPFSWPVRHVGVRDRGLLWHCSGYLAPTQTWTPRFIQMLEDAKRPIVSPWRIFSDCIGTAFEKLASEIELMPEIDRNQLVVEQAKQLRAFTPTQFDVSQQLEKLL